MEFQIVSCICFNEGEILTDRIGVTMDASEKPKSIFNKILNVVAVSAMVLIPILIVFVFFFQNNDLKLIRQAEPNLNKIIRVMGHDKGYLTKSFGLYPNQYVTTWDHKVNDNRPLGHEQVFSIKSNDPHTSHTLDGTEVSFFNDSLFRISWKAAVFDEKLYDKIVNNPKGVGVNYRGCRIDCYTSGTAKQIYLRVFHNATQNKIEDWVGKYS